MCLFGYSMLSHFSRVWLCDAIDGSPLSSPIPGILQARPLEWVAISFSNAWKWSLSVVSDSSRPHGLQPSRLLRPWDFPGKSTGVGGPLTYTLSKCGCPNLKTLPLRCSIISNMLKKELHDYLYKPKGAHKLGCRSILSTHLLKYQFHLFLSLITTTP